MVRSTEWDETKLKAFKDFLLSISPGCSVVQRDDFDTGCRHFRIDNSNGSVRNNLLVSRELLSDRSVNEIIEICKHNDLEGTLKAAGKKRVTVISSGIMYPE